MRHRRRIMAVLGVGLLVASAHAYVGPGLGAGALAVIVGFLMSIFLAVVGVFWYPIKRLFRRKNPKKGAEGTAEQ